MNRRTPKKKRRRAPKRHDRLASVLLLALVSALIIVALLLLRGRLFAVRTISVQGLGVVEDEVARASGIELGAPLSSVNEREVRQRLESTGQLKLDALTVVQPGTVILQVSARERAAWVLNGGVYLVLDADGVAMETTKRDAPDSAVYVYGLGATSYTLGQQVNAPADRLEAMKAVLEALKALNGAPLIRELDVSKPSELTMNTLGGVVVELGDKSNMQEKLRWMISAVNDLDERGESGGTLDVRSGLMADYRK